MGSQSASRLQYTGSGLCVSRPVRTIKISNDKSCLAELFAGKPDVLRIERLIFKCGPQADCASQHGTALMIDMCANRADAVRRENVLRQTPGPSRFLRFISHCIPQRTIPDEPAIFTLEVHLELIAHEHIVICHAALPVGSDRT